MELQERLAFEAHAMLPCFKRRVEKAKEIIREALAIAPAYVAISWGKDSLVLADIVSQIDPNILLCFVNGLNQELLNNYSEVSDSFLSTRAVKYIEFNGNGSPSWEVFEANKYNLPQMVFLGLRMEESSARKISLRKYSLIHKYKNGGYRCCPLMHWSWQDIWAYIVANNLVYLKSYDSPYDADRSRSRTSAITTSRGSQFGRFEKLRKTSPEYFYKWINND